MKESPPTGYVVRGRLERFFFLPSFLHAWFVFKGKQGNGLVVVYRTHAPARAGRVLEQGTVSSALFVCTRAVERTVGEESDFRVRSREEGRESGTRQGRRPSAEAGQVLAGRRAPAVSDHRERERVPSVAGQKVKGGPCSLVARLNGLPVRRFVAGTPEKLSRDPCRGKEARRLSWGSVPSTPDATRGRRPRVYGAAVLQRSPDASDATFAGQIAQKRRIHFASGRLKDTQFAAGQ